MLLLPGTLPADRATLTALCAGLAAHADLSALIGSARVEPFTGSWGDAERLALPPVTGGRFAVATPLHAALGMTDLTPLDPALIALDEAASRALCEATDEHMRVDGVRLAFVDANTWHVTCDKEVNVLTERPDWMIGEPLRPNLPRGKDARLVERWLNELQMSLFAHPVNAAREERSLPPINVVWLWGFGSTLPLSQAGEGWGEGGHYSEASRNTPTLTPSPSPARGRGEHTPLDFLSAHRNGNVPAWQDAWQTLSSKILSAKSIILGDSRPRLLVTPRKPSSASKIITFFQHKPTLEQVLTKLQQQL